MCHRVRAVLLVFAVTMLFAPAAAVAQTGSISGTVRDAQGAVMPGVTVEVTSPQLIEKVRSTITDGNGRYQIQSLPVGTYVVTFKLEGFATVDHSNVEVSTDFTAPVNAQMKVGSRTEVVTVVGTTVPLVDVQNASQRQVFTGAEVADLPTTRNLGDLVQLVPGIAISAQAGPGAAGSTPMICSGGQGQGGFSGALSGCSPVMSDGFNAHASINDGGSLNQGRIQVDGMSVQNLTPSFGGGTNAGSSIALDTGNAQEIVFTLSGALGESETGGTTINIVPRTGGNRYAGNYFTAYSADNFYGRNNKNLNTNFENRLIREYDINGAFGGPIRRDRLWFYATARQQDRETRLTGNYRNLNEGVFGANYQYDPANQIHQADRYQNASVRLTLQATRRDKFNIFWDEQYTCESPCRGGAALVSLEATGTQLTRPRNTNVSWTNPLTGRILLEAAASNYTAKIDDSRHRSFENRYTDIPRIAETGNTAVAPGSFLTQITSGSINNATVAANRNIGSRASLSYVTGSHNLKLAYQGQYISRDSEPYFNDLRMQYSYGNPAANCVGTKPAFGAVGTGGNWCGLRPDGTRNFDGRPESAPLGPALATGLRVPVPTTVTTWVPNSVDEKTWSTALYAQDQWTVSRFTLSGALRYDNARSKFGETCVGPDVYKRNSYCLNDPSNPLWGGGDGTGVHYHDITPRMGAAWDIFGNGKTALKWSAGKYLAGSTVSGIYTAPNPASGGRTVTSLARTWRDLDGDRIVDCDLVIPEVAPATGLPQNGECGTFAGGAIANSRRFGRSPNDLDELGLAVGLGTVYCSRDEIAQASVAQVIRNYCENYFAGGGKDMFNGWGVRQYEWQQSIGLQHQILSRLSGEVTWNRRKQYNVTASDLIGSGCDLHSSVAGGTVDAPQCMRDLLEYKSEDYDFYGIRAPLDPRLPGGGGYVVEGIPTQKPGADLTNSGVRAVTITPDGLSNDVWTGVDTNFIWRPTTGLRVSGGTSTGRRNNDLCGLLIDDPPAGTKVEHGGKTRECLNERPWQTNLRGTASYTIPWVDVQIGTTFSVRPGVERGASHEVLVTDVVWGPHSQARVGTVTIPDAFGQPDNDVSTNLFDNATYGERSTLIDLKLAKNIRFKNKRINIGADIYNVFNSNAALGYCGTLTNFDNAGQTGCTSAAAATAGTLPVQWGDVTQIVAPRYARFQIRMDF